jgi:proteasome component ECM29
MERLWSVGVNRFKSIDNLEEPIGCYEDVKKKVTLINSIFKLLFQVWNEGTSGTEGGLRLYLREIIPLLTTAIESPQWRMKALAARAMATVASKLGESLPRLDKKTLLAFLINALGGRTWNGKESVLLAVRELVSAANNGIKDILTNDENLKEELLVDQVLRKLRKLYN